MISPETLETEIKILEDKEPNYAVMQQLASLYIVKDHMPLPVESSDFMALAYRDINKTMAVMEELMETLQMINPRLYEGVLSQLM